ncbi:MAG: YbjN domain-containing protein [Pseudomonadota bacterium]
MTAVEHDFQTTEIHPIDMVESLAEQCSWEFDRVGEDQIAMVIEGAWRTYSASLAWSGRDDMLRLISTFELSPPEERLSEIYRLLNLANDRIWGGSFSHWAEHGLVAYRHGMSLAGAAHVTHEQIESMVMSAIALSERFYPAFQLVAWGDEPAEDSLKVAIEEAYGTA